ncbi:MAG: IS1634 family transposase [Gammaproteobacteria bacterium]|nr:IS1634 family transposase [Gammaproteobacteria bacterium]
MAKRSGTAHVVTTTRKYKGKVYRTHLLRRSYREGKTVKNETLGNLSHLPDTLIDIIRRTLKGESFVPLAQRFEIMRSRAHGHVEAVDIALSKLGLSRLLVARPCRERDLVLAMVAARILAPHTKLATTRWWHSTTLAEDFGVADATEDDLYAAMDWLLERQGAIEKKLAARHLQSGGLVLYDLSSSYFEGSTCPLAKMGYNRDGKKGKLQVNYGLLTDPRGCPVAVSVHEGNTADPKTILPQVQHVREQFGIAEFVIVGDRGMLSHKAIDELREHDGIGWVTALKSVSIRALIEQGAMQLDLFDERNLFEFTHPDYPDERLVACRNPELAKLRAHKRESLLQATERNLDKARASVAAGRLRGQDKIGVRVGKVLNQYKVAKHFELDITDDGFYFSRNAQSIATEAALDGLYIIRTSLTTAQADDAQCVRYYKLLAQVERAFRSMKSIDLHVRPIHHRLSDRVRAHIFLCMLAYYVEWHLREAWRELMFADEDQAAKATRDPVAPAKRTQAAETKVSRRTLDDGTPVHSFHTLLTELSTIVRNTLRTPDAGADAPTFDLTTVVTAQQQHALDLARQITV